MNQKTNLTPFFNQPKSILRVSIPSIVSLTRLVALPFLLFSFGNSQQFMAACLFLFMISTDLVDGFLARKLKVSSSWGAAFDSTVDFLAIGGLFLYFGLVGIYPLWVFGFIVFMFSQFIVTSFFSKVIYDPIGKYYGSLLFGAVGLTILSIALPVRIVITISIVTITAISFLSRMVFLSKKILKGDTKIAADLIEDHRLAEKEGTKTAPLVHGRSSRELCATIKYQNNQSLG